MSSQTEYMKMATVRRHEHSDVITKDKLNKIEQGVKPQRGWAARISQDKDWGGKNITNVGSLGAASIRRHPTLAAGSNAVLYQHLYQQLKHCPYLPGALDQYMWVII